MSAPAWTEADRLKTKLRSAERARVAAEKKERRKETGFRLVFAISTRHRFSTNRIARRISVGERGDHAGVSIDSRRIESLRDEASKYESLWWGVSVRELLVALDLWLEAGCPPRRWRKLVEPVGTAPAPPVASKLGIAAFEAWWAERAAESKP